MNEWLDRNGYHHAHARREVPHPYVVSPRMGSMHARKIHQEPTGREVFGAHARKAPRPYIPDGQSRGRRPGEFDPVQLAHGTEHEMEHTTSRRLARQIAMDHLVEDPLYYVRLRRYHR